MPAQSPLNPRNQGGSQIRPFVTGLAAYMYFRIVEQSRMNHLPAPTP